MLVNRTYKNTSSIGKSVRCVQRHLGESDRDLFFGPAKISLGTLLGRGYYLEALFDYRGAHVKRTAKIRLKSRVSGVGYFYGLASVGALLTCHDMSVYHKTSTKAPELLHRSPLTKEDLWGLLADNFKPAAAQSPLVGNKTLREYVEGIL